ncbi:hypothetical protein [Zoogloea sp.]|jgi:hypothetical protein|uniref:hypothetical protein n=1 Tax=Zoogloea sp. TaxID=49181 RepID=UPI001C3EEB4B|nr:hypothetical protein [Pseudomonas aeruginosa]
MANLTLTQAQQRYIDRVKELAPGCGKRIAVGARLELSRWAKRHGFDQTVVLNDARDMVQLERDAKAQAA